MDESLREALLQAPEAKRFYETSPVFKEEIDKIWSVFSAARKELSDEEYADFLSWGLAFAEEWKP